MSNGTSPTAEGRDRWTDRLSDYLDGELSAADRAHLETHLAGCADCAATLAGLREVVARARDLGDPPPPVDLWPAIEARLEPRAPRAAAPAARRWWGRRFDLGLPQLAAAAMLLVALSAGAVWLALRGAAGPASPGGRATPAGPAAPVGDAVPAALEDPRYDAAVAELERALDAGRGRLDPRTLLVIEQNLRIIDRAIEESRRAVAADPGNAWLRSHLASTMMRKVDLLRSATLLADAQS